MTEKSSTSGFPNIPVAPVSTLRPVRLMPGGSNPTLEGTATQPHLLQSTSRTSDTAIQQNAESVGEKPAVKPVAPIQHPALRAGTSQPIYGNTSYDRRLAKRRRIDEKKLSWRDARQFSQFVTPFKWQIALAFCLTVAVGLTALPMPYIFHTMLDQVFPRHDAILFSWSVALLLMVLLLAELL